MWFVQACYGSFFLPFQLIIKTVPYYVISLNKTLLLKEKSITMRKASCGLLIKIVISPHVSVIFRHRISHQLNMYFTVW